METHDIAYYIAHYSYLGIFVWFVILDQTTPVPEELVLITIGYMSHSEIINPFLSGLSALLGLMTVDNIYFYLATKGNKWIEKLAEKKRGQLLKKFQNKLRTHPLPTLFMMSFIPKVRFLMPIIAGLNKITFKQFFNINTSASFLYVSIYLSLGVFFHKSIGDIIKQVDMWLYSIFGIFMIITTIVISRFVGKWLSE